MRWIGWFVVLVVGTADRAWANAGVFGGSGHTVWLESTADVELVEEEVDIHLGRSEASWTGALESMDRARYRCLFVLRNRSAKEAKVQVGFPVHVPLHAQAAEDDAAHVLRLAFLARDDAHTYHTRFVAKDARHEWGSLFLWDMTFAPGETRRLRVAYELPVSVVLAPTEKPDLPALESVGGEPFPWWLSSSTAAVVQIASYVTKTGGSWAGGKVGRARFRVFLTAYEDYLRARGLTEEHEEPRDPEDRVIGARLPVRRPFLHRHVEPAGWRPIPGGIEWQFTDWTPGEAITLMWLQAHWPSDPRGLDEFSESVLGPDPDRGDLTLLREVLDAGHGMEPRDPRVLAYVRRQLWYAPVAGRVRDDLDAEARALFEELERRIARARWPARDGASDPADGRVLFGRPLRAWTTLVGSVVAESRRAAMLDGLAAAGGDPQARPHLLEWLDGSDETLRRGALWILAKSDHADAVSTVRVRALADLKNASAGLPRLTAAAYALYVSNDAGREALFQVLGSEQPVALPRAEILRWLRRFAGHDVALARAGLASKDRDARMAAVVPSGRWARVSEYEGPWRITMDVAAAWIDLLLAVRADADPEVVGAAVRGLGDATAIETARSEDAERVRKALLEALDDPRLRLAALDAFGRLPSWFVEPARARLTVLSQEPAGPVRRAAADVVRRLDPVPSEPAAAPR